MRVCWERSKDELCARDNSPFPPLLKESIMESDLFSLPALSRAVETRDSAAMRGFYAENARLHIIDRDHPPSHPQEIAGRSAIAAYFDDICGRSMSHKIE